MSLKRAVLEPHDPVGDVANPLVVADDDDAPALLLGDPPQQPHDLVTDLRVEIGGRLIGQDERRVVDQRPGDRHPLLLAARQLLGQEVEPLAETQVGQELRRLVARRAPLEPGQLSDDRNILQGGKR